VTRGEIWLVRLDPIEGSEIAQTRPCLVVSPPELNDALRTVIVAPMTTGMHPRPFRIEIGLAARQGLILLDQLRTVDNAGSSNASA